MQEESSLLHLDFICDREAAIEAFIPKEYWSLDVLLDVPGSKKPLKAQFYGKDSKKLTIENETQLNEIVKAVESDKFVVKELAHKERKKKHQCHLLQVRCSRKLQIS